MNLNYHLIIHVIGMLLVLIGVAMMPALIVAAICAEKSALIAFAITIAFTLVAGAVLVLLFRPPSLKFKVRDGVLTAACWWILVSIIGAMPFIISGEIANPIDAFFESASGFSTTGASILTNVESLSSTMLFWRSFTQWLGGIGILVFSIILLPSMNIGSMTTMKSEVTGPSINWGRSKFSEIAKILFLCYFSLTIAETLLLCIGGLSFYDALLQTFSTIGTGGFSNYNDSVAHFGSPYVNHIVTFFMILAGVSFPLIYAVMRHGLRELLRNDEFKLYIGIIILATLLIMGNLYFTNVYDSLGESFEKSLFQTVSITTTTGYTTVNYNAWPTFSKMILWLLMFVGGSFNSTSGGIKVLRILILLKLIRRSMSVRLHPNAIITLKHENKPLAPEIVSAISGFIFLYIAVIFGGTILVSLDNFDFMTSFSAVLSCVGNIGPGFELVGPELNYDLFSDPAKLLLSFLMLAGRLELFTIIMLFSPRFWNPNR